MAPVSDLVLRLEGRDVPCEVSRAGDEWAVRVGGRPIRLRLSVLEPGVAAVEFGGRTHLVRWAAAGTRTFLHVDGVTAIYEIDSGGGARRGGGSGPDADALRAPMPGAVAQVYVRPGETVKIGQPLLVVEAMKMEHVIRAPHAGTVRAVHVRVGERVEGGAVVVEIGTTAHDPASSP